MKYNLKRIERKKSRKRKNREIGVNLSGYPGFDIGFVIGFAFRIGVYHTCCKKHKKHKNFNEFILKMAEQIYNDIVDRITGGAS